MKRAIDFVVTSLVAVLSIPLFLVLYLAVLLSVGSPVLFSQIRPGLHGRPFRMYKFRTMKNLVDESGELLPDHLRMARLGELLRSWSLDELPELWNVVRGDMSLVGPRPLLLDYLPLYSDEQARRHEVRPGITGWAQVNGRNAVTWEERFKLDVWYVDNQSIWLDAKILLMTVKKVLIREGISADGHVTMEKFKGNSSA